MVFQNDLRLVLAFIRCAFAISRLSSCRESFVTSVAQGNYERIVLA